MSKSFFMEMYEDVYNQQASREEKPAPELGSDSSFSGIPAVFEAEGQKDGGFSDTRNFGHSPAARSDAPQDVHSRKLLELIHSDQAVKCYGGRLFRSVDQFQNPVISFAVANMTPTEIAEASEWYNRLGRMSHLGFLHRASNAPVSVDKYTVFDFEIAPNEQTLLEMSRQNKLYRRDADMMMQKLVNILVGYNNTLAQMGSRYIPLSCISMETVVMDPNNNLKLLPLVAFNNHYPIEIPREVIEKQPVDARSDLFAAAYVAVEIYSAGNREKKLLQPESKVIRDCLAPIRDWRPELGEVYSQMTGSSALVQDSTPERTAEGNRKKVQWMESIPGANGLLDKLGEKVGRWTSRITGPEEPETPAQTDRTAEFTQAPKPIETDGPGFGADGTFTNRGM